MNDFLQATNSVCFIDYLPSEIMSIIFSFLEPRDLARCSQVKKLWFDLSRRDSLWIELYTKKLKSVCEKKNFMGHDYLEIISNGIAISWWKLFELSERVDKGNYQFVSVLVLLFSKLEKFQLKASKKIRILLLDESNPPIQQVIDIQGVPRLVYFLTLPNSSSDLKLEAAWSLTNITSGSSEQTQTVIKAGALPIFIDLLNSPEENLQEQSVWALGNISGESTELRDEILRLGTISSLVSRCLNTSSVSLLHTITWTISNLCRGTPSPDWELVKVAVPSLITLTKSTDQDVVSDSCWALHYLTSSPFICANLQYLIYNDTVSNLLLLSVSGLTQIAKPSLHIIYNLIQHSIHSTTIIQKTLESMQTLISHNALSIRELSCKILQRVLLYPDFRKSVFGSTTLLTLLIEKLTDGFFEVRCAATNVVNTLILEEDYVFVNYLLKDLNGFVSLCNNLEIQRIAPTKKSSSLFPKYHPLSQKSDDKSSPSDSLLIITLETLLNLFSSPSADQFKEYFHQFQQLKQLTQYEFSDLVKERATELIKKLSINV